MPERARREHRQRHVRAFAFGGEVQIIAEGQLRYVELALVEGALEQLLERRTLHADAGTRHADVAIEHGRGAVVVAKSDL